MLEPIIACGCTRKFLAWIISWSLWVWVAVHRMITRVLRDIQKYRQHWVLQVPQSTQMWVLVATLSTPLINNLTSVVNISQTQSTSTSIAWQYNSNVEVTPKGLIKEQVIGTTSTTSQYPQFNLILIIQCLRNRSNAIKTRYGRYMIKVLPALLMIRET